MIAVSVGNVKHNPPLVAPAADGTDALTVSFGHIVVLVDRKTAVTMADSIRALDAAMTEADYEEARKQETKQE